MSREKTIKITHAVIFLLLCVIAFYFGDKYSQSDIKDIISTLQNISTMIFTISGIWLAYIYPDAIKSLMKPSETVTNINQSEKTEKDIERISLIVKTIVLSALVMFLIILTNLTKPIFSSLEFVLENKITFGKLSFLITALLVYLQIIALLNVVGINVVFLNDIHNEKNKRELNRLR
ncbi:hypothetical protein [Pectobacterium parmentieri]|uniref:hypothetical protein n=1 Tax=Pectobacterium parmentieri TaxID=1905730 RepID=UPI0018DFDA98|nr:hypothetical protein [Pectobacterium parmentieri]MBI0427942.1 hypothetical protein [Pectobacterium parmentieri]